MPSRTLSPKPVKYFPKASGFVLSNMTFNFREPSKPWSRCKRKSLNEMPGQCHPTTETTLCWDVVKSWKLKVLLKFGCLQVDCFLMFHQTGGELYLMIYAHELDCFLQMILFPLWNSTKSMFFGKLLLGLCVQLQSCSHGTGQDLRLGRWLGEIQDRPRERGGRRTDEGFSSWEIEQLKWPGPGFHLHGWSKIV